MTTPSCFSIRGIDLFSASMRGWRCSAMRMVGADTPGMAPSREPNPAREITTAAAMAPAIRPTTTPARSTVAFIDSPRACSRKSNAVRALQLSFFHLIVYTCAQLDAQLERSLDVAVGDYRCVTESGR